MSEQTYRVIQWMTGRVGKIGIRHFAASPAFDLVGVLVHDKEKVGKDAGEIAGIEPVGVVATDDVEAILAMDADCVFYTPWLFADVETICRILRTGKNVVTTAGYFHPNKDNQIDGAKIEAACRAGGTSFHGGGIHPGYAGDVLPLTLARVVSRIDTIHVYEIVNVLTDAPLEDHLGLFGFGKDKNDFLSNPTMLGMGVPFFAQAMATIADGLGREIDEVTAELTAATATEDITHQLGVIRSGSVAAQRHDWTAWSDGKPLIVFHAMYTTGDASNLDPAWDWGKTRYRIVIDGDPPTELTLEGGTRPDGSFAHPGYNWTAMSAIHAIPDVCDAPPGWITQLDLGLVRPRGLV
jgi:hypothetical protein